ncbi:MULTISPECIES: Hpt domain-containing protein [Marinobacter]|jgi:HPt (histidine-containing phosphotransfer) domain-containing protein|uniref:Hpt domain-containing protein n=1 Tax=Marinobacter TaxID=2742 RepID=UPI001FFF97CF|nr:MULTISPECIES: Hpt domain-containing protein [Marinobacter]MCK2149990.1 Hpt domain-containing protein [Marinobacter alexandrii]
MTEQPHLDGEALAELQDVMEDEFDVLMRTFLYDSRERIASLKQAVSEQDAEALAHAAHSFKGSCINIGAPLLGELCRTAENAGKEQRLEKVPAIIDAIEEEFRNVADLLEKLMVR